jgi:hypothetical protein
MLRGCSRGGPGPALTDPCLLHEKWCCKLHPQDIGQLTDI